MKDQNPNFDFYAFNALNNKNSEEQKPEVPEKITKEPAPVVPNEAQDTPAISPEEQASNDAYAKDIDRALARDDMKKSFSRLGIGFVVMTIAWYFVAQLLMTKVYELFPDVYNSYWFSILASTVPLYVIGLPLLYLIVKGVKTEIPERKKLKFSHFVLIFIIAQTIMTAGSLMGETFVSFLSSITGINFENSLSDTLNVPLWLSMLTTVVCAPLFEELIFRKIIMDRMLPHGELAAILVYSFLFGAFHGNFYQFFYATMLGLLLSFLYARTGNWWNGVFLHMLINFFGGVVPVEISNWLDYDTFVTLTQEQMIPYITEHLGAYLSLMGLTVFRYGLSVAGLILFIIHFKKFALRRKENEPSPADALTTAFSAGGIIASIVVCALFFGLWFLSAWLSTVAPAV